MTANTKDTEPPMPLLETKPKLQVELKTDFKPLWATTIIRRSRLKILEFKFDDDTSMRAPKARLIYKDTTHSSHSKEDLLNSTT